MSPISIRRSILLLSVSLACAIVTGCNSDRMATQLAYREVIGPAATQAKMKQLDKSTQGKSSIFQEEIWKTQRKQAESLRNEARRKNTTWKAKEEYRKTKEKKQKEFASYVREIAKKNGRLKPNQVLPLYNSPWTQNAKKYRVVDKPDPTYPDAWQWPLYPFFLVNEQGKEVGIILFVIQTNSLRGAEVTFHRPAADYVAAIRAVGADPTKGYWEGESSGYRTFVYGKINSYTGLGKDRIVVRPNLSWLVLGVSRP